MDSSWCSGRSPEVPEPGEQRREQERAQEQAHPARREPGFRVDLRGLAHGFLPSASRIFEIELLPELTT